MKVVIVVALLAVLAALASAGVFMLRKPRDADAPADKKMARALAWRVGLSVALFLFILFGYTMGWIQPTGIPR
jgi:TRAP-type C4-dicarboxylate transport system permease large subunit